MPHLAWWWEGSPSLYLSVIVVAGLNPAAYHIYHFHATHVGICHWVTWPGSCLERLTMPSVHSWSVVTFTLPRSSGWIIGQLSSVSWWMPAWRGAHRVGGCTDPSDWLRLLDEVFLIGGVWCPTRGFSYRCLYWIPRGHLHSWHAHTLAWWFEYSLSVWVVTRSTTDHVILSFSCKDVSLLLYATNSWRFSHIGRCWILIFYFLRICTLVYLHLD